MFLLPFFFVILRLMIFDTVPRDEYEPFLLWLLDQPGGAFLLRPTAIACSRWSRLLPSTMCFPQ